LRGVGVMPLWLADKPLVLASKSASRRALLEAAGIPLEICPADIDERAVERAAGLEGAGLVARRLAWAKAEAVSAKMPGRLVVADDQSWVCGEPLLDNPSGVAAPGEHRRALAGQPHALHTAIALARDGRVVWDFLRVARMTMREFSDVFLDAYLEAAGPAVMA